MQRGANGLTVDDAIRLDKKLDRVLLGKAPPPSSGSLPSMSFTEGKKPPECTATLLRVPLGCAHPNFGLSLVCG